MFTLKLLEIKNVISFREQVFEFRNGKAILIVGKNLDDSSQNGNGSGKSSLIEAVALAFTGTSLRDVKTKELIHSGAASAEVTLTLKNTVTGVIFVIWRKIYANTSSAEYKAWINGKEQRDRYSDLNSFNAFVWETIGITKEDFFSFFLITKENYNPFFLVGDTKKKEIINRFSGANLVDNVFLYIEDDCEIVAGEIKELEKEITIAQTKVRVISDQVKDEENRTGEEAKQKMIEAKEQELQQAEEKRNALELTCIEVDDLITKERKQVSLFAESIPATLLPFAENIDRVTIDRDNFDRTVIMTLSLLQAEIKEAEKNVNDFSFSKDYPNLLSGIANKKDRIESDIATHKISLIKVKEGFSDEIISIQNEERELRETIRDAEQMLQESEAFESKINKQLQDAITCPNCSHKFSLRDKTFSYEEAVKMLPEIKDAIAELTTIISDTKVELNAGVQRKKDEVNRKVLEKQEKIKAQIEALNNELINLGEQESELSIERQKEINDKQRLIDVVASKKQILQAEKDKLDHQFIRLSLLVDKAEQEFKQKEQELNYALQEYQNRVRKAELIKKGKVVELESLQNEIKQLQDAITKLREQQADRTKIKELEAKIEALIRQEENLGKQLDVKRKEKESKDAWVVHFKNFKSHLANKSIKNIEDYTNLYLNKMGSNLGVNIDGYRVLSNKKVKEQITTTVTRNGFDEGSIGKFSGGERGRIDVSNILGMQELVSVNAGHGKGLDLLFCDEILESIDVMGMECIINSLQSLGKTIMLVSQNDINTLADHTLVVQKKGKISVIVS